MTTVTPRPFFLALLALGLAVGCGPAESADNPDDEAVREEAEREETPMVAAGTQMTFRLSQALSTETHATGDRFAATLVGDVRSPSGEILVPAGTRANGVVAFARESSSSDEPAVLELRLESLEVGGETKTLDATVVEAAMSQEARDSGGETAAKIAVGAAAGALLGRILGRDREGAVIGAGAGAVAGTVFAVTTDSGHARIGEGATVTVSLDEPLAVD
jgi:hypothetical protein